MIKEIKSITLKHSIYQKCNSHYRDSTHNNREKLAKNFLSTNKLGRL